MFLDSHAMNSDNKEFLYISTFNLSYHYNLELLGTDVYPNFETH